MMSTQMMSALFFVYALAFIQVLAIAAQARTLSGNNLVLINLDIITSY